MGGVLDLGVGILDRLRLSAFIPRLDIAVKGSAQLCTDEHFMVVLPPMEDELRRETEVHIDVSLELWAKGTRQHRRARAPRCRGGSTTSQGSA